jgi:hypothetical protein
MYGYDFDTWFRKYDQRSLCLARAVNSLDLRLAYRFSLTH